MGVEAWLGRGTIQTLGVAGLETTAEEVVAKAVSAVGNREIRVASEDVARKAAEKFLGPGSRELRQTYGSRAGQVIGRQSADGLRQVRFDAGGANPHYNFDNVQTGGNLHVYFH